MERIEERRAFSARLKTRLKQFNMDLKPPAVMAAFNQRFKGKPVSAGAVRKWLEAEAIPTQDKLRTLAEWLGVSTEWLRFGPDYALGDGRNDRVAEPTPDELLLSKIARLSPDNRKLIEQLVDGLLSSRT